ncbi:Gfo/Idh/MocA family oxidoreductase [Rubellicoccus peritrichatus]|uniref:Gfo/Idh/MocA family oxidoreductase n=1 Tax=Rubellicoccus peritrichatus TaxID=3080537 RepID=A0AAQ3QTM6_9BACT|nr:Gfo/Idh/MocA family oxidoreductase [Puniceicoccus sp. CR14]WOO39543.1 Gfo/Idh/MocA family oxidoreductase [Puniceicoccus sp. CR14]
MNKLKSIPVTRRTVLKSLSLAAAYSILPRAARANTIEGKLRIAQVGVGGQGKTNLGALLRHPSADVVALCDVDSDKLAVAVELCPEAETYRDYRVLFDEMSDEIDAVLVSTPDHMHAPIAMAAMELGKHVYCEKPLAHNVVENRELRLMADEMGLVTQMGIQLSSSIGQRMTVEYIRSGLIGKVSEVHVWSSKSWGSDDDSLKAPVTEPPEKLDWELWLGIAEERPYRNRTYHPALWRRLVDFGTGTLGDMGVHIFDTPYRALKLTAPLSVRSECRQPNGIYHPKSVITEYTFPSTSYTAEKLKWVWYDGRNAPPASIPGLELEEGMRMPEQGCVMVGENATLMMPHHSAPRTFPRDLIRSVPRPKLKPIDHHGQWIEACLTGGTTGAPFSYGGPLCEALQIGVVANRFPGQTLEWDADNMRVTNLPEANRYLSRKYRAFAS